jgi:hypothetical protein
MCDLAVGERIDLRTRPDLSIVRCDGQDVSADNFAPAFPGEFDLRMQFVPVPPEKAKPLAPDAVHRPPAAHPDAPTDKKNRVAA